MLLKTDSFCCEHCLQALPDLRRDLVICILLMNHPIWEYFFAAKWKRQISCDWSCEALNRESFILAHLEISDSALSSVPSSLAAIDGTFCYDHHGIFHPTKTLKKRVLQIQVSWNEAGLKKNTHLFTCSTYLLYNISTTHPQKKKT